MSDGGTMTRVAAIREALATRNLEYPLSAREANHLLRLVKLAAEMPEPMNYTHERGYRCVYCDRQRGAVDGVHRDVTVHAPDCPWAAWRAAHEEVVG